MTATNLTITVFVLVYVGMALGRVPWLKLDRTGIALLGLIALLGSETLTLAEAGASVDVPTLALLFALMIVSAQFENAGFYGLVARQMLLVSHSPRKLLAVLIAATGFLSAILTNDVVVFALTAPVCAAINAMKIDGRPYLMALAAAANAGSAATLIGNPQNILIGQAGNVPFWGYLSLAIVPTLVALVLIFIVVSTLWRLDMPEQLPPLPVVEVDQFQLGKAIAAIVLLAGLFLTPLPREVSALCVAGLLLVSRRLSSRAMIGAVDWHLLLLFTCLFVVTAAFEKTGVAKGWLDSMAAHHLLPDRLSVLAPLTLVGSNSIGNVPAVVLLTTLMPKLATGTLSALAMLSTFSGNLLLTGSMCNIIVAEIAATQGVRLNFGDFARAGILLTVPALLFTCAWLWGFGLVSL